MNKRIAAIKKFFTRKKKEDYPVRYNHNGLPYNYYGDIKRDSNQTIAKPKTNIYDEYR